MNMKFVLLFCFVGIAAGFSFPNGHQDRESENVEIRVIDARCNYPKDEGPCQGYFPSYYFNKATDECEELFYGGCKGNDNNFKTIAECKRVCGGNTARCNYPKDEGPCKGYFPSYYFNKTTEECEEFVYGGCKGNDNKFKTIAECKRVCGGNTARCNYPKDEGPCKGYFPSYYFNKATEECEEFVYGGCKGNDNKFKTIAECKRVCGGNTARCNYPKDEGPCKGYFPSYYFNKATEECEEFVYGGCKGNDNKFKTIAECKRVCGGNTARCNYPKDEGPCKGYFPSYYFNKATEECEEFVYGGCKGNDNKFETIAECKRVCGGNTARCNYPKDEGPCKGYFPSYYFNKATQECEEFVYGGCKGNDNKFETIAECKRVCGGNTARCNYPKDEGPCKGYFPSYYFNKATEECEEFVYGGCKGNDNKFKTIAECKRVCGGNTACNYPKDEGPCKGYFPSYYFNKATEECEEFVYGGCKGNDNKFKTIAECKRVCGGNTDCKDFDRNPNARWCAWFSERGYCVNPYIKRACCKTCTISSNRTPKKELEEKDLLGLL